MADDYLTRYPCPDCDELHEDEEYADNCCYTYIDVVYVCEVCEERYWWSKSASMCCLPEEPENECNS